MPVRQVFSARELPRLLAQHGVDLPRDRLRVADERDLRRHVRADLLRRDVHLDDAHVGLKRGGRPKCMIQFSRAPIRKTRSAFCSACERAGATDSGWSSGITPLPIGEARNGSCVDSMNSRTSSSARAYAMPLPTITSGRSADFSAATAASTDAGSACGRGASGTRGRCGANSSSTLPLMMSPGRSRYTGPGRP